MEEQLKFFPLLSLKEMAVRRVAVLVWSDPDVLASISRIYVDMAHLGVKEAWQTIEDGVKVEVTNLELPTSYTKQVMDAVRPVGLEIRKWKQFHEEMFDLINDDESGLPGSTKLCWTAAGSIDYQKTAKELCCNAIGVEQRYQIACHYCLEDSVALLFEQLSEEAKEHFSSKADIYYELSFLWPCILKGEQFHLDRRSDRVTDQTFHQYWFERFARLGNKNAAAYFFQKLTLEEREASVVRSVHESVKSVDEDDRSCEVCCYLLPLMTPEKQMETLKEQPASLFICFLNTIWPDLFLENAPLMWKYLRPGHYAHLQRMMVELYRWKDLHSSLPLRVFFMQAPPDFKRSFVDPEFGKNLAYLFVSLCFDREDSESVEALFRHLDAADREQLIFDGRFLKLLFDSIFHNDRWPVVQVCLREAMLSRKAKDSLEKYFEAALEREGLESLMLEVTTLETVCDFLDACGEDEERGQKREHKNDSSEY